VVSPITAACVACHDSSAAKGHMVTNGGSFYDTRANAKGKAEACLVCHGPTSEWPIATMHQ
jgi:cytochrome c553